MAGILSGPQCGNSFNNPFGAEARMSENIPRELGC